MSESVLAPPGMPRSPVASHPRPLGPSASTSTRTRPERVRRIAVRFASPTPLDSGLTVNAYGINDNSFAIEATVNDSATITNGRLELRT